MLVVAVLAAFLIDIRRRLRQHLERSGHPRRRARDGRVRAPAAARAGREGHQRPVRHHPERPAGDRQEGGGRGREEAAMTLWWIGDAILVLVVIPVVVYLLRGVLRRGPLHRPVDRPDRPGGGRRLEGPRRRRAPAHHPGAGGPDDPARRGLRRVARRHPRRRRRSDGMSGAAWVTLLATLVIVLALVYYLVSTIAALRQITKGLDGVIASVGEIVEKSAPVNDVVRDINRQPRRGRRPARGPARPEGRPDRRRRPGRRPVPGCRPGRLPQRPRQHRRARAADRRGLHARDAHAGPARPRGPDRHGQPGGPGDPLASRPRARRPAPCTRTSATPGPRPCRARR